MKGYLYHIQGGGSMWLPLNPNSSYYRMSYSVYVYDPTGASSIKEAEAQQGLSLFPNPTIESSNLSFYIDKAQETDITVVDINGKLIKKLPTLHCGNGWQTVEIDTQGFNPGIYFVRVMSNTTAKTIKLIKQ